MEKKTLKKLIDVAARRQPADLVIRNSRIIDVYNSSIIEGKDIAIADGHIAGIGCYDGDNVVDAEGKYAVPGFIDGHIHIESSYVTPEEFGKMLVPFGTTTIIADPHEIVNVCGMAGMNYMLDSAKGTKLDIKYMLPSCVPATPFENSGAIIDSTAMIEPLKNSQILGLGEFMDYPGVVKADDEVIEKIMTAKNADKLIDGHSPGLSGHELNAYSVAGIHTDHECSTIEEMNERISCGLYVLMREGSACHDLRMLVKGVTTANSRRCLLCSDDRQPKTIFETGHMDNHLRICVEEGLDPIMAIQMAGLNASECFGLKDRGAIAPGLRADIALLDDLKEFRADRVFILGEEVARKGKYLPQVEHQDISTVKSTFNVKDFSLEKLRMKLKTNHVNIIDILPDGVLTAKGNAVIRLNEESEFVYDPAADIVKIAVIERHKNTGNVALGLIRGYGIKKGAVAISIAHDSHNIIAIGTNDEDMAFAVENLIKQEGGIILVQEQAVISSLPLVIGGLMSDQSSELVNEKLTEIHEVAHEQLGISKDVEPIMTLCFMSLAVIPEIKITDMGLFDVTSFSFIPIEAE